MIHKNINRIKFNYIGSEWLIAKTNHLYDKRSTSQGDYARDEFLDNERYIAIMKCALRNGLTSFRNKGNVVITLPSVNNIFFSVLCKLDNNNKIVIISVYRKKILWWKCYIKEKNRIMVFNDYVIPKMSINDVQNKQMNKIQHQIIMTKEDKVFKGVMNSIKDLVRF